MNIGTQFNIEDIAHDHKEQFSDEFLLWLPENGHIYMAFEQEAFKIARSGFKHYSARTILEFLRHHSALAERNGSGWKINNNFTPYLARLFAIMNPHKSFLFEYRTAHRALRDGITR